MAVNPDRFSPLTMNRCAVNALVSPPMFQLPSKAVEGVLADIASQVTIRDRVRNAAQPDSVFLTLGRIKTQVPRM